MRKISVGRNLVAEVKTTIYKVPSRHTAQWDLLFVSNQAGNNKTVSVWWWDASQGVEVNVIDRYVLSGSQFLKFDGNAYVTLEEFDEVRITTELGSVMSSINSFDVSPSATSPLI